jgi:hypothetical protein
MDGVIAALGGMVPFALNELKKLQVQDAATTEPAPPH